MANNACPEAMILAARAHLFKPSDKIRSADLEQHICYRFDHGPLARLHRRLYRQLFERRGLPRAARDVGHLEALTLPPV